MRELYELLPNIISYIVIGFLFVEVFNFVVLKPRGKSLSEQLLKYLIFGFVLKSVYELIPYGKTHVRVVIMLVLSIILGFCCAKVARSNLFRKQLAKINVRQDGEKYIWGSLFGDYAIWVTLYDYENDVYYYGKLVNVESFKRKPYIVLSEYLYEKDGSVINNFKDNPEQVVLLDTARFKDIRISYNRSDSIIGNWSDKN